jgi:hypothetical protein
MIGRVIGMEGGWALEIEAKKGGNYISIRNAFLAFLARGEYLGLLIIIKGDPSEG